MDISLITRYFPHLGERQQAQLGQLEPLYREWNEKINVISRKDIDHLMEHHVLHSLGLATVVQLRPGTRVMDVGTGGGFPGIPLAILFPEAQFLLVDSIGKKVRVAGEVARAVGLDNVEVVHENVKDEKRKFDFVVSRGVMKLPELVRLVQKNVSREQHNALPNGLLCLKGGELGAELHPYRRKAQEWALSDTFKEPYFETKKVVYVPLV